MAFAAAAPAAASSIQVAAALTVTGTVWQLEESEWKLKSETFALARLGAAALPHGDRRDRWSRRGRLSVVAH